MKINFILPSVLKAGGVIVVLEYARRLGRLGHEVRVYYPLLPYSGFLLNEPSKWKRLFRLRLKPLLGNLLRMTRRIEWLSGPVQVRPIPFIHRLFVGNADATIATAWPTAYSVHALPPSKGAKYYLIQHYETWDSEAARVEGSYLLPLKLITIAPWLTALMRSKFSRPVAGEIHNGIDRERFRPGPERSWESPALLMLFHESEWKCSLDGIRILRNLKAAFPQVRVRLFGISFPTGALQGLEYHRDPAPEFLLELYRTSHIFLSPSASEGWGLPVVEAMACGCAVVATRTGCVPLLEPERALLASEPGDFRGLQAHMEYLLTHADEARAMAGRGIAAARKFDWDESARRLAGVLSEPAP
ncbi:MAG TPA: glycosyltransferase family 4 protein [Fibrobacteria bacterium]|nr:glycosyltransferase family 4 protein [Fibrobacteria bacterium]